MSEMLDVALARHKEIKEEIARQSERIVMLRKEAERIETFVQTWEELSASHAPKASKTAAPHDRCAG